MAGIRKILVFWVCLSFTFFQLPCSAMAEYFAQVKPGPTIKKPEALTSPEEEFPVAEKAGPQEKGGGKWLWALIGVALVGGVAAAMSGGGGGGGSGNGEDTTGTIVISGPAP